MITSISTNTKSGLARVWELSFSGYAIHMNRMLPLFMEKWDYTNLNNRTDIAWAYLVTHSLPVSPMKIEPWFDYKTRLNEFVRHRTFGQCRCTGDIIRYSAITKGIESIQSGFGQDPYHAMQTARLVIRYRYVGLQVGEGKCSGVSQASRKQRDGVVSC